jgi:hypothetical protein
MGMGFFVIKGDGTTALGLYVTAGNDDVLN